MKVTRFGARVFYQEKSNSGPKSAMQFFAHAEKVAGNNPPSPLGGEGSGVRGEHSAPSPTGRGEKHTAGRLPVRHRGRYLRGESRFEERRTIFGLFGAGIGLTTAMGRFQVAVVLRRIMVDALLQVLHQVGAGQ